MPRRCNVASTLILMEMIYRPGSQKLWLRIFLQVYSRGRTLALAEVTFKNSSVFFDDTHEAIVERELIPAAQFNT